MDAKIKKAIDYIISNVDLTFREESFIYPFTNENIKGYLTYFDLNNKEILSVVGSGDHVLNMLLNVDKIDAFDINLFAYYFFVLKKYAIAALEIDEYLDFFDMNNLSFDIKKFEKIKRIWQEEKKALEFFEYLFHLKQAPYLKETSLFVRNKKESVQEFIERNNYLNEQNYNILKRNILDKQVIFHHKNIKSLKLDKQFDYIFMSNITDYLYDMFSGNVLGQYKKFLYSNLIPMLKQNGKIVSYLYDGRLIEFSTDEMNYVLNYGFTKKTVADNDKILIYEKNY